MPNLPSLPETAHLSDLLARFPKNIEPLMIYVNSVLRSEGALTIGERELIAAFVSGLNSCRFCYGSHVIHAKTFGIDPDLIEQLLDDLEAADVSDKLKSILRYVEKLNILPSRLIQADLDAVLEQGWSEEAIFEAVEVAGLFNMMNRIVEGGGVSFDYSGNSDSHVLQNAGPEAAKDSYLKFLGIVKEKGVPRLGAGTCRCLRHVGPDRVRSAYWRLPCRLLRHSALRWPISRCLKRCRGERTMLCIEPGSELARDRRIQ